MDDRQSYVYVRLPSEPDWAELAKNGQKNTVTVKTTRRSEMDPLLLSQGAVNTERPMEAVMNVMSIATRVLAEFEEMPGMTLTLRQASRLFGLSESDCQLVLDMLVDAAYLRETGGRVTLGQRTAAA